ncbi:MAG: RagB/SusD family nutrient uptake outer membrane protein [Prevotellaceae bacterium]|jgi:hypothetical protein|nr:RagB/SusD family nutrient uptake outer membrane protein [Prevotellaceae bacterium]
MNELLKPVLKLAWQIDAAITHEANLDYPFYAFSNFTISPYNSTVSDMYRYPYWLNNYTNRALERIDELSNATENERQKVLSRILFLRAYAYSTLLNYFGGVPIVFSTYDNDSLLNRESAENVANQIFSDLNQIISINNDTLKYMASQLEARVALNQGLYQKTFDAARRVIDSRRYTLSDEMTWGSDAVGEAVDIQLPSVMSKGELSYPFRYAEILLLYAEAAIGLGNNTIALQTVNQLEQWQTLSETQSANTEDIKNSINNLWSVILNKEGHRFAQLKRSGKFLESLAQYGAEEKHKLLPIPDRTYIPQNPGWEN